MKTVWIVLGGCVTDEHIIAVCKSKEKAEARAAKENQRCPELEAHIEEWVLEE